MTAENCIILLEKYKKQMEDPRDENGVKYHGDQRRHAISRSKHNYETMKQRILTNPKFIGGTIKDVNGFTRTFERHPFVDTLIGKPKAEKKAKEIVDGDN